MYAAKQNMLLRTTQDEARTPQPRPCTVRSTRTAFCGSDRRPAVFCAGASKCSRPAHRLGSNVILKPDETSLRLRLVLVERRPRKKCPVVWTGPFGSGWPTEPTSSRCAAALSDRWPELANITVVTG